MKINTVAVVGAGNMGSGIAQKIATEGYPVILLDRELSYAQKGKSIIQKTLEKGIERKLFKPEQVEQILERITPSGDLKDASKAQLIIEAVFENLEVKQTLFSRHFLKEFPMAFCFADFSYFQKAVKTGKEKSEIF